jgi:hypothetical protein
MGGMKRLRDWLLDRLLPIRFQPFDNNLPVVDVRDFGAVGDGATDDTVAVQRAVTAMTDGGTLYFGTATYSITYVGSTTNVDVKAV